MDAADLTVKKRCPFCAEEILADAVKCRYCGEFLNATNVSRNDKRRLTLAICGSALLIIAPFTPIVSAPLLGRLTLFHQGTGDGVFLMAIAAIALALSFRRRYGFQLVSGLLGLVLMVNVLIFFWVQYPELLDSYRRQMKGNAFGVVGEAVFGNLEPDWGAAVLLAGSVLSLWAALIGGLKQVLPSWPSRIAAVIVLLFGTYNIVMAWFPYLRLWPLLFSK